MFKDQCYFWEKVSILQKSVIVNEAAIARIKLVLQGFNRLSNPFLVTQRLISHSPVIPTVIFGIDIRQIPDPEKLKYWGPLFIEYLTSFMAENDCVI